MSSDNRRPGQGRGEPQPFRNIPMTEEIVAMGFTDIQVQTQSFNMVLRHENGLLIISKYDLRDLTKTARLVESQLAQYIGKEKGLPDNFDPKRFSAILASALYMDMQQQLTQKQEQIKQEEKRVEGVLDEIKALRDENSDISFEHWQKRLVEKYDNLKKWYRQSFPKYGQGLSLAYPTLEY